MAPIRVGKLSVEITVNSIDGFIHELIEVPFKNGFWIVFTVKDQLGRTESFPMVDQNNRVQIYDSYSQALHEAAQRLMHKGAKAINIKPEIT
jgi:hypothetical protein